MRPTQLTEQHGHELAPTGKPSCMALRRMSANRCFKLDSRKQLQQLTKNAAYSIHGGNSLPWFGSALNSSHRSRAFTSSLKPIRRHPVEIVGAALQPKM